MRGVVTERGLVRADNVLGAGGVWSSMFCRRHRVRLPQAVVYGSVLRATVDSAVFSDCLSTPTFSARASMDGTYIVAISGHGTVHITPSLIRNAWNFIPLFMERRKGLKIRFGKAFFNDAGPDNTKSRKKDQGGSSDQNGDGKVIDGIGQRQRNIKRGHKSFQ